MHTQAITYAVTLVTLLAVHQVADHWVQSDDQATHKGERSLAGRLAAAGHVATYTAALAAALLVVAWRTGLSYDPWRFAAGMALTAGTHYWADRRVHLLALAAKIGKGGWIDHDDHAPYLLDQSWHVGWLMVAALIMV
jgi:hypothetical protein